MSLQIEDIFNAMHQFFSVVVTSVEKSGKTFDRKSNRKTINLPNTYFQARISCNSYYQRVNFYNRYGWVIFEKDKSSDLIIECRTWNSSDHSSHYSSYKIDDLPEILEHMKTWFSTSWGDDYSKYFNRISDRLANFTMEIL